MKYISYILITLIPLNTYLIKSSFIGFILAILYIAYFGLVFGNIYYNKFSLYKKFILGIISLLSVYSIILSLIFYFSNLATYKIIFLYALISIWLLIKSFNLKIKLPIINLENNLIYLKTGYYISIFLNLYFLYHYSTLNPIRSPWQIIDYKFYLSITTSFILLLILNTKNKKTSQLFNISIFYFVLLNVGNILYRLGYGYDGFIHQATEKLLQNTGDITPKPFYYIGHYSMTVFLSLISFIKVSYIDRLLPSLIASFAIPVATYIGVKKYLNITNDVINNTLLTFLILPFLLLGNPTPQALSLSLSIITIFLSLAYLADKSISFAKLLLFFVITFLIHPISAIPLFVLLIFIIINKLRGKLSIAFNSIFLIISSFIFPLAFYIANFLTPTSITIRLDLKLLKNIIQEPFKRHYNYILDLMYLSGNGIYLIFLIIAVISLIIIFNRKKHKSLSVYFLSFTSCMLGYLIILLLMDFTNLPVNEKLFYSDRILQISFYLLLPFIFYISTQIQNLNNYKKLFLTTLLTIGLLSSTYLSFPRYDDYNNSNFINLSQYDISTVHLIDSLSNNYVVLANQMTSAAAIREFGFDRNLYTSQNEKIYFYPIPTGQKLYDYYLELLQSNNPVLIAQIVKEYTGKEKVYVVLNSYWSNSIIINKRLQASARNSYYISDQINIYEF